MKKLLVIGLLLMVITAPVVAQHKSFQTLEAHFKGQEEVHSFRVSGFLCRMVLGMAGEWEFRKAIEDVKHIRLMVIPGYEFKAQNLTAGEFKKVIQQDGFEELATIRDGNDYISLYVHNKGNKNYTYFVWVEEPEEVVAIELKGYINPSILTDQNTFSRK